MVPPGFSEPSFSAASIIERAMRSLIEPPGLALSSFTKRRQGPVSKPVSSSIGVRPIRSRAEAAGGGRGWVVKGSSWSSRGPARRAYIAHRPPEGKRATQDSLPSGKNSLAWRPDALGRRAPGEVGEAAGRPAQRLLDAIRHGQV